MHNKSLISHIPGDIFCVGFGLLPDNSLSHWIPIGCHISYLASFLCASNVNLNEKNGSNDTVHRPTTLDFAKTNTTEATNITAHSITSPICPFGWILLNDSCFYTYTVSSAITFIEAENLCSTVQARIPTISKPYLGHSKSYEASNSTIFTPPKTLPLEVLDKMHDMLNPAKTSVLNLFKTNLKEMMLGFRLIATEENMNLALLLQMMGEILHFRSNIFIRGSRQQCFILEFDTHLSNMLPDLHTVHGKSVSGWILIQQKCSEKYYYVLPLVCTKHAIDTKMACSKNHYKCSDESCILLIYRCDGFNDCVFPEDEHNCSPDNHLMVTCFSLHADYSDDMIPFHSLCDGIPHCPHGTDESFCLYNQIPHVIESSESRPGVTGDIKQAGLKQQKLLEKPLVLNMESNKLKYTLKIFLERLKNNKLYPGQLPQTTDTGLTFKWWPFYLQCSLSGDMFLFDELCKHKQHGDTVCGMGTHLEYCKYVKCSGMFKCTDSFCIEIGDVCDRKQDCVDGEDEMFCNNLSCPGMLRCRGETRCVPPWRLCDGHAQCLNTFDDEVGCNRCPEHCECDGRVFICKTSPGAEQNTLLNSIKTPNFNDGDNRLNFHINTIHLTVTHLKIKTFVDTNNKSINYKILHPTFKHIIWFDMSYCRLKTIDNILVTNYKQIAFVNVSNNRLYSPNLLMIFSELPLHHLDISYNEFIRIETPDSYHLRYLEIFKLTNNKISHLDEQFISMASNVRLLDLRHNPIKYISLHLVRTLKHVYTLEVTDREICCVFASTVKCNVYPDIAIHTLNIQICQDFIADFPLKISSQFILTVCILINLSSFILNVLHIKMKKTQLPVTYLNINISLSGLTSICYVISVFLFDNTIERQPITYFKTATVDISCISKQIFCLIMLQMDVYLLILKSLCILSRIKYPFQHQCQWIKLINIICILLWMIAAANSTIMLNVHYSTSTIFSFFRNCHILAESKNNTLTVKCISFVHSIFYLMILMTYIYIVVNFHITVRQSMSTMKHSSSTNKNNRFILKATVVTTFIEIFLILAVSVATFVPCVFSFTRNLYVHFYIFLVLFKTLSKDILHSLHPSLSRLLQGSTKKNIKIWRIILYHQHNYFIWDIYLA